MAHQLTPRQKIINEVRLMLGDGMIDIELTPEYYDLALDLALDRYFQRSSNSTDERVTFIELQPDQVDYVLPKEVLNVKAIHRRGTSGGATGTGINFDPSAAAFVNQSALGLGTGPGTGSLITYELYTGYQELVGKMFGLYINYSWNPVTHTLSLVRNIRSK